MEGMLMEQVNGFNFRRIIERQTTEGIKDDLPDDFDVKTYFERLRAYVAEMHKRGIFHLDLHLRNLMIDRETSAPVIIDFGKARYGRDLDKSVVNAPDYAQSDFESLRIAENEAREWIAKQSAKVSQKP
jgi:tRNA A-37 threonylcarbamoyl transferase component Bud32